MTSACMNWESLALLSDPLDLHLRVGHRDIPPKILDDSCPCFLVVINGCHVCPEASSALVLNSTDRGDVVASPMFREGFGIFGAETASSYR